MGAGADIAFAGSCIFFLYAFFDLRQQVDELLALPLNRRIFVGVVRSIEFGQCLFGAGEQLSLLTFFFGNFLLYLVIRLTGAGRWRIDQW